MRGYTGRETRENAWNVQGTEAEEGETGDMPGEDVISHSAECDLNKLLGELEREKDVLRAALQEDESSCQAENRREERKTGARGRRTFQGRCWGRAAVAAEKGPE